MLDVDVQDLVEILELAVGVEVALPDSLKTCHSELIGLLEVNDYKYIEGK